MDAPFYSENPILRKPRINPKATYGITSMMVRTHSHKCRGGQGRYNPPKLGTTSTPDLIQLAREQGL